MLQFWITVQLIWTTTRDPGYTGFLVFVFPTAAFKRRLQDLRRQDLMFRMANHGFVAPQDWAGRWPTDKLREKAPKDLGFAENKNSYAAHLSVLAAIRLENAVEQFQQLRRDRPTSQSLASSQTESMRAQTTCLGSSRGSCVAVHSSRGHSCT